MLHTVTYELKDVEENIQIHKTVQLLARFDGIQYSTIKLAALIKYTNTIV